MDKNSTSVFLEQSPQVCAQGWARYFSRVAFPLAWHQFPIAAASGGAFLLYTRTHPPLLLLRRGSRAEQLCRTRLAWQSAARFSQFGISTIYNPSKSTHCAPAPYTHTLTLTCYFPQIRRRRRRAAQPKFKFHRKDVRNRSPFVVFCVSRPRRTRKDAPGIIKNPPTVACQ